MRLPHSGRDSTVLPILLPSHGIIKLSGSGLLDVFRIGYFGVVFYLAFQTFPVHKHIEICGNFDVAMLSKCVCIICTITGGRL